MWIIEGGCVSVVGSRVSYVEDLIDVWNRGYYCLWLVFLGFLWFSLYMVGVEVWVRSLEGLISYLSIVGGEDWFLYKVGYFSFLVICFYGFLGFSVIGFFDFKKVEDLDFYGIFFLLVNLFRLGCSNK